MSSATRRQFLYSAAGAFLAAPAILKGTSRPLRDKPNLLFLWTDNSGFRAPVLNRLASESIVFRRHYVAQPVRRWSHGCILTGVYPRAGVPAPLELLNDSTYRTGYFGKWRLGDEADARHGFDEWISMEDNCSDGKPAFLARNASRFITEHRNDPWLLHVNFLCSQVDEALGRILWSLEASGQADNTVVVCTRHHGVVDKSVFHEETIRVPLLIRAPFLHQKQIVVDRPSSSVDIVPTVLDLIGREGRDNLSGPSLVSFWEGKL